MKIDITKLEGYRQDMTADEKLALIEKYDLPDPDFTGHVQKDVFDKKAKEAAEWKRKHDALLTEEERKEAARRETEEAIKGELEALRKEKAIADNRAQFLTLGYDEKLADETARAFADGDMKKVFDNQKLFVESVKKAERAAAMADNPKPPAGGGSSAELTKEQFAAMGYSERLKVFNEQPETYKKFTEG